MGKEFALFHIHFPADAEHLQHALFRLKFEELFMIHAAARIKLQHQQKYQGFEFSVVAATSTRSYNEHLPFELTNAQKRV